MSTNVSKQKREKLVEQIKAIKTYIATAPQDENTAQLLTYIAEIEKDIKSKKYGLVFEEHRETIDEVLENSLPVLCENESLFINNGGQMNFLIEGDNLASLKLLEKTHKGKIDLIYIDPPYNTGNKDFVYDDAFIDNNDTFRHSKWLSFMGKRLSVAKELLSESGVIFISIDDNEQAQIKLMCDDIFSADNFIADLIWANQEGGGSSDSKYFKIKHEHIICYSKNINQCSPFVTVAIEDIDRYKLNDEYEKERGKYQLVKLASASIQYSSSLDYEIECPDGSFITPAENSNKDKAIWRWSKAKLQWGIENGFVEFRKDKKNVWQVYTKQYINCDKDGNIVRRTKKASGIIMQFSSTQGSNQLFSIFGSKKFGYPKPVDLILWLIERIDAANSTILDFFAGSGTTGHAVMKLNAEDGGQRKFILCTNNENNICREVTYERIKRVIEKEDYNASLKYFKVDFLPISDKLYYEYADELLKHIKELVELENGINFNCDESIAIILTEEELDEFVLNIPQKCKTVYLGHDVLPSETQEKIFKKNGITTNIIPDYYYRDLEA